MQRVEDKIVRIIRGEVEGKAMRIFRAFLFFLSKIYGFAIRLRLKLFHKRFFRPAVLGCPVISVGNITVGGTGKTPVVEMLARELSAGGRKVAIISRGYMKKSKHFWQKSPFSRGTDLVSDGRQVFMDAKDSGDEPYMLAKNLDGVCVLVDKNRIRAGSYAIDKLGVDTILLDDGFQYLSIQKSHEILLVDSTNPFGYEHLLPRGLLREPKEHLLRADFVFLTKTEKVQSTSALRHEIKHYSNGKRIFECIHDPKYLVELFTEKQKSLVLLQKKRICALSAIAVPEGFEDTLQRLGAQVVLSYRFRDHHRFSKKELLDIVIKCREEKIDYIITTEKDAVRIPKIGLEDVQLFYLRVEIKLVKGASDFNDFVHNICYY